MNKNNAAIDIMKVVFSLCVIAIHTNPILRVTNQTMIDLYSLFVSFAVPFFFTTTGFLTGKKLDDENYVKQLRKKYIRIYLIWNAAYLPITIWGFIYNGQSITKAIFSWVKGFLLLGEQFCSWPLWYLLSIIYGTFVLQIMARKSIDLKGKCLIAISLFLLATIVNHAGSINPVFGKIVAKTVGNGRLLTGPCFMILGSVLSDWEVEKRTSLALSGGGIVLAIITALSFHLPYSTTYISAIILVPLLVKTCGLFSCGFDGKILRKYSKVSYFTHMYFVFLFQYSVLSFSKVREQGLECFVFSVIGTLIVFAIDLLIAFYKSEFDILS